MNRIAAFILVPIMLVSCIETSPSTGQQDLEESVAENTIVPEKQEEVQKQSLTEREQTRRERNLDQARAAYSEDPTNEEKIIWYGRRLAYLAKYNESINIYSIGLNLYPESYRLLRHRGHRHITTRNFKKAIDDLQTAAFYSREVTNAIEPDGIPNAYNKPLSNDKFNIWYHLGLAFYLNGNYDKAISAYKKCMEFSNNADLQVATAHWLYSTYRKIGNIDAAEAFIEQIPIRAQLIENRVYHDLIMMYRGLVDPQIIIRRNTSNSGLVNAAAAYGVGNYLLLEGNTQQAREVFKQLLESGQWDSFGFIAAEADSGLMGSTAPL